MWKLGTRMAFVTLIVFLFIIGFTTIVYAADNGNGASYGETSEGCGPGLQNCWGKNAGVGVSVQAGYGFGESSYGTGPSLQNRWGKVAK